MMFSLNFSGIFLLDERFRTHQLATMWWFQGHET